MAKVFTPEEIHHNAVPVVGAHAQAAEELMWQTTQLADDVAPDDVVVHGASVYGSACFGTANIRSDVDGIVGYEGVRGPMAEGMQRIIQDLQRRHHVPLEVHVVHGQDIADNTYPMSNDVLYVENLHYMAGRTPYAWGEPMRGLQTFVDLPERERMAVVTKSVATYAVQKYTKFFRAGTQEIGNPSMFAHIQRALELPSALGRKLLRMDELFEGNIDDSAFRQDSTYDRSSLANATAKFAPENPNWQQTIDMLLAANNEYDEVLATTLAGTTSQEAYKDWLYGWHQPLVTSARQLAAMAIDLVAARAQLR